MRVTVHIEKNGAYSVCGACSDEEGLFTAVCENCLDIAKESRVTKTGMDALGERLAGYLEIYGDETPDRDRYYRAANDIRAIVARLEGLADADGDV